MIKKITITIEKKAIGVTSIKVHVQPFEVGDTITQSNVLKVLNAATAVVLESSEELES